VTWVKSRLVDPSGKPIEGAYVKAALMSTPTWLADSVSQVARRALTHTGPDGLWRLDLIPYTAYESQLAACSFYHIVEGTNPPIVTVIRVPEAGEGEELWMRDLVFDPDPCSRSGGFIPINTLARLHDVDASSLALAKPGDFLVLLPNGKWGAGRAPMPLGVTWTPDPDDMFTIQVTVVGFGGAGARVGFGDGSAEQIVYSHEPLSHTYAEPGSYILTATDVAWPAFTGSAKVGVKDHMPRAHAYLDGGDDWRILLWLDEAADDTVYSIDWGDGTPLTETRGQNIGRVPPRPRVPHQYNAVGHYELVVIDRATKRETARSVEVADLGVLITYDTPSRPRTTAIWLATGAGWEMSDDIDPPTSGIVPPSGRVTQVATTDREPGQYSVEVRETVNGQVRRSARRQYIHPSQWDSRMNVEMTWRAPGDPVDTQTVTVTAHDARTRCTVEWGDASASTVVDPGVATSHRYNLPAPAGGWRLRLTETGIEDARVWSRALGEPRHVGTPVMSARTRGAVDLDVVGIDHDFNDDWYAIVWEVGEPPDPVAAVGPRFPANHVYATPGHKTLTLDAPGMVAPITREVDVVFYPAPVVTVAEERDQDGHTVDPARMTTRISVDNSASGGNCTVWPGDGTAPRPCSEVDTFIHQYQTPGTYAPIVTSDVDSTAQGRATVTVPFGLLRSLFFELTGVEGDFQVTCTITSKDPSKVVHVQWDSGGLWDLVPPNNQVSHTYPTVEGTHEVVVAYTDDSEAWSESIDIPWTP
jgi:hypothetical protein